MKSTIPVVLLIGWVVNLQSQIYFEDSAEDMGIIHTIHEWTIGSGISLYDFDQDGLDDMTCGSEKGKALQFFKNTGDGFELLPPLVSNESEVKQILWSDFDNDGDPDLYVSSYYGVNRLYENLGDLVLEDITEQSGLPIDEVASYGACWGDYNRDGWLDLYTSARGIPGLESSFLNNRLFENNADGTFKEVSVEKGVHDPGKLPFCASFIDFNNDMWPDIYIANDKLTYNTMFENVEGRYFDDVSKATRTDLRMNAMCVTSGDFNRDGWADIYVTNTPVGNKLLTNVQYKNGPEVSYADETTLRNVGFYGNGWGSNFIDADNDGDLDLYVSGSIDGSQDISSVFYENIGAQGFITSSDHGFNGDTTHSFVNAVGDINNDGLPDIAVQNNAPYNYNLWQNKSDFPGNWLKLDLTGVLSNREGIGSKVDLYYGEGLYQSFYTKSGTGFLAQNSRKVHIGLGDVNKVDSLVVTWPTGHVDIYLEQFANQTLNLTEGETTEGKIFVDSEVTLKHPQQTTSNKETRLNQERISTFPNPFTHELRIYDERNISEPLNVKVLDSKGSMVYSVKNISQETTLDLSSLESGVYLLYFHQGHKSFMKKVIKH